MFRCPKCHRFGMDRILYDGYQCLWIDCREISSLKEIEKAKHPIRFKKFIDSIKPKTKMI